MARLIRCNVRVVGGGFATHDFSSDSILDFNQVAVALGISASTLRRLLRRGEFPQSHISRGKKDFWQKQDLRAYQMRRILIDEKPPAERARYRDPDKMDQEDEGEFGLKPLDLQGSERAFRSYTKLLAEEPEQFVREHPNLKEWATERGYLRKR